MPRTSPYSITLCRWPNAQNSKPARADIRHRILMSCGPGSCCTPPRVWATTRFAGPPWDTPRQVGVQVGAKRFYDERPGRPDRFCPRGGRPPSFFPPDVVVAIKALAGETAGEDGHARWPRWAVPRPGPRAAVEFRHRSPAISGTTILGAGSVSDAIKPWQHRSLDLPPATPTSVPRAGPRVL